MCIRDRLGVITGGLVLVIILCAVFILPQVVSLFYYNPNRSAGTSSETGISTTQMSLDLSVYSELFLPGGHRDYVSAMPLGYGAVSYTNLDVYKRQVLPC